MLLKHSAEVLHSISKNKKAVMFFVEKTCLTSGSFRFLISALGHDEFRANESTIY